MYEYIYLSAIVNNNLSNWWYSKRDCNSYWILPCPENHTEKRTQSKNNCICHGWVTNIKHRVTIPCKWSFEKRMKSVCFSWKAYTFCKKCAFHEKHLCFLWKVHFSWKAPALFMKSTCAFCERCTFHEKHLHFSWKAPESNKNSWTQHKSLILTWSEGMHVVHMPFKCFSCAFHF